MLGRKLTLDPATESSSTTTRPTACVPGPHASRGACELLGPGGRSSAVVRRFAGSHDPAVCPTEGLPPWSADGDPLPGDLATTYRQVWKPVPRRFAGLTTPPCRPTEGLPLMPRMETFGWSGGKVGRPCHNRVSSTGHGASAGDRPAVGWVSRRCRATHHAAGGLRLASSADPPYQIDQIPHDSGSTYGHCGQVGRPCHNRPDRRESQREGPHRLSQRPPRPSRLPATTVMLDGSGTGFVK